MLVEYQCITAKGVEFGYNENKCKCNTFWFFSLFDANYLKTIFLENYYASKLLNIKPLPSLGHCIKSLPSLEMTSTTKNGICHFWYDNIFFNLLRLGDAYMRQYNIPIFVQIMACHLFGAKPLSKPMLPYCQSDPKEYISVKFYLQFTSFHWKCCLRNGILSLTQYAKKDSISQNLAGLRNAKAFMLTDSA